MARRVPTLDGDAEVTVRPGTQPGDRLRMRGYGIPHVHAPARKGDQYVQLHVRLPREVPHPCPPCLCNPCWLQKPGCFACVVMPQALEDPESVLPSAPQVNAEQRRLLEAFRDEERQKKKRAA
jgi:DnaJ-class molecular chaperone